MNGLESKTTQRGKKETKIKAVDETNPITILLHQKKQFLPWLIALILVVCVAALFASLNSHRQAQTEMQEQLERQNLVIDSLEKKQGENVDSSKSIPVITSETIKRELGSLQELVTQEYIYTNADKREQDAKWIFGWSRPFSNSSLLLTYDGTIKAGIDMGEVQVNVNEESRTIIVPLPAAVQAPLSVSLSPPGSRQAFSPTPAPGLPRPGGFPGRSPWPGALRSTC